VYTQQIGVGAKKQARQPMGARACFYRFELASVDLVVTLHTATIAPLLPTV
jgi:hypothetical protein